MAASVISPQFSRPTWAHIDLAALRNNALFLKTAHHASTASTPLIAVIKANAYGHGAIEVARVLEREVTAFAVASVDEGRALRQANIQKPILLLSAILPDEAVAAFENNLLVTVSTLDVAGTLNSAAKKMNTRARTHLKIDTGMGRLGVWHEEAAAMWSVLREYSHVEIAGIYTHFACADGASDAMTPRQIENFRRALEQCGISKDKSEHELLIHSANSAAALRYPLARFDAIRCGIALYGASPFGECAPNGVNVEIEPVMSLRARVTEIRKIKKGRSVSYGATWTATRDSVLALVPLGYADGYQRALSNKGEVLLRGKRCPVVGRVTMDQILVDVSGISPNVSSGEIVTAWGRDESGVLLSVEEVAGKAGTISYELLCGVAARVPRVYVN